jgi:hypothetical protein
MTVTVMVKRIVAIAFVMVTYYQAIIRINVRTLKVALKSSHDA